MFSNPNQYVTVNLSIVFQMIPYIEEKDGDYTLIPLSKADNKQKLNILKKSIEIIKKSQMYDSLVYGELVNYREPRDYSTNIANEIRTEMVPKLKMTDITKVGDINQEITVNMNGLILLMMVLSSYKIITKEEWYEQINPYYDLFPDEEEAIVSSKIVNSNLDISDFDTKKAMDKLRKSASLADSFYEETQFTKNYVDRLETFIGGRSKNTYFIQDEKKLSVHDIYNPATFLYADFLFEILSKDSLELLLLEGVNPFETYILNCWDKIEGDLVISNSMNEADEAVSNFFKMIFDANDEEKMYSMGNLETAQHIVTEGPLMTEVFRQKMWSKEHYIQFIDQFCKASYTTVFQSEADRYTKENEQLLLELLLYLGDLKTSATSGSQLSYQKAVNLGLKKLRDLLRKRTDDDWVTVEVERIKHSNFSVIDQFSKQLLSNVVNRMLKGKL